MFKYAILNLVDKNIKLCQIEDHVWHFEILHHALFCNSLIESTIERQSLLRQVRMLKCFIIICQNVLNHIYLIIL